MVAGDAGERGVMKWNLHMSYTERIDIANAVRVIWQRAK
jgi:hypothetical protein